MRPGPSQPFSGWAVAFLRGGDSLLARKWYPLRGWAEWRCDCRDRVGGARPHLVVRQGASEKGKRSYMGENRESTEGNSSCSDWSGAGGPGRRGSLGDPAEKGKIGRAAERGSGPASPERGDVPGLRGGRSDVSWWRRAAVLLGFGSSAAGKSVRKGGWQCGNRCEERHGLA